MNIEDLRIYPFKGFMDEEEALRLYELAREASRFGLCLEIGSYCGLSAAYLGMGCRENGGVLYSIDHHRGSEEQQPGQEYFDPDLVDPQTGLIDTFPLFLKTIAALGLEDTVIPIVAKSAVAARNWSTPLSLVFIDGGHTFEAAFADYSGWVSHIMLGGFLVIHDIFFDLAEGGQAPFCIYRMALASGLFTELPSIKTLGVLRRADCGEITVAAGQRWEELCR
ncbi:MAG: class I SAM-dependent methyltransferase [Pseudomonadota bacterium]